MAEQRSDGGGTGKAREPGTEQPGNRKDEQARYGQDEPRNPHGTDADRVRPIDRNDRDRLTGERNRNPQEIDPGTQRREDAEPV